MKLSLRSLLKDYIVREALEQKEESPTSSSLDAQVDRLLGAYEAEAKNLKKEGYDFRTLTRRFLSEAEEDVKGDKKEDGPTNDSVSKMSTEDIDVVSFASSVTRLIDNYDQLLEVRDTLVKRARDFLKKNYEDDVVSSFMSVLRDEYDIDLGISDVDKKFDLVVPPAAGAGPSPSGGG